MGVRLIVDSSKKFRSTAVIVFVCFCYSCCSVAMVVVLVIVVVSKLLLPLLCTIAPEYFRDSRTKPSPLPGSFWVIDSTGIHSFVVLNV